MEGQVHLRRRRSVVTVLHSLVTSVVTDEEDDGVVVDAIVRECTTSTSTRILEQQMHAVQGAEPVTIKDFMEKVVPSYSSEEFKQHFRMSRSCY